MKNPFYFTIFYIIIITSLLKKGVRNLNKRKTQSELRKVIKCLRCCQNLNQPSCANVAGKKLEILINEAPASLVYELSCIHSQLINPDEDITAVLSRMKKILNERR